MAAFGNDPEHTGWTESNGSATEADCRLGGSLTDRPP